jgi:hypothetical protein
MWTLEELEAYLLPHPLEGAGEIDALYPFLQQMHGQETLEDDFSIMKISLY